MLVNLAAHLFPLMALKRWHDRLRGNEEALENDAELAKEMLEAISNMDMEAMQILAHKKIGTRTATEAQVQPTDPLRTWDQEGASKWCAEDFIEINAKRPFGWAKLWVATALSSASANKCTVQQQNSVVVLARHVSTVYVIWKSRALPLASDLEASSTQGIRPVSLSTCTVALSALKSSLPSTKPVICTIAQGAAVSAPTSVAPLSFRFPCHVVILNGGCPAILVLFS